MIFHVFADECRYVEVTVVVVISQLHYDRDVGLFASGEEIFRQELPIFVELIFRALISSN